MVRAMIAKDAPALEAVLDEGFVLVHMTGLRQDRAAFIQAVLGGRLNYYACEDDAIEVDVRGDTARLVGRSRMSASVFLSGAVPPEAQRSRSRHTWRLEQVMTLAKRDGEWRFTHAQAGTY